MSARTDARGPRAGAAGARGRWRAAAAILLLAAAGTPGCYTAQMTQLQYGLDSLRQQVDRMNVRDSVSARTLEDTRRELAEQRDQLLATRATASSTSRETGETLGRLEGKLDDIMARFRIVSERTAPARPVEPPPTQPSTGGATTTPGGTPPATTPAGPAPTQLYDQATQDLTQGRYAMALATYRDFLRRFPDSDLADNAQYGAGECFFAQARFDSALVEYARVGARWGTGDRAPASLYKLGLCEDRLGRAADARRTFEDLVQRFPHSGEAQLARDRLSRR
jgi:tol-pal system protein YbgF